MPQWWSSKAITPHHVESIDAFLESFEARLRRTDHGHMIQAGSSRAESIGRTRIRASDSVTRRY